MGLATGAVSQTTEADGLSPESAAALSTVERVCLPLLRGQTLKAVAAIAGLKQDHGEWTLPIAGRKRVVIDPPGGPNKTVCSAKLTYSLDGGPQIVDVLSRWAQAQAPALQMVKDHEDSKGPLRLRKTTSWFGMASGGSLGLVLSEEKDLQGRPAAGDYDEATLLVSLTPG
ncbi:MAG: hypothetical protein ABIO39_13700 [Caulobacteraceae bacterium]